MGDHDARKRGKVEKELELNLYSGPGPPPISDIALSELPPYAPGPEPKIPILCNKKLNCIVEIKLAYLIGTGVKIRPSHMT